MFVRKSFPLLLGFALAGCMSQQPAHAPITVEGRVSVRGAEPFTGVWLETDMRTSYVLVMDDETKAAMVNPALYRVTGTVYLDDWNGRPMAHLAVGAMTRLDR